jgi:hypothetical protein
MVLAALVETAQRIPHHHGFIQLIIDHQRVHLEAELGWMDTLLERLSSQ